MDGPLAEVAVGRCRSRSRVQTTQPAGREAWFDPGVFVAAVLDGLTPGARYYYMCARRRVRARARVPRGDGLSAPCAASAKRRADRLAARL